MPNRLTGTEDDLVATDYEIVDARPARSGPPRKWEAGGPVRDLHELDIARSEGRMLWRGSSPRHPAWISNMPYGTLVYDLRHGRIRYAAVRLEYRRWVGDEAVSLGIIRTPEEVARV